MRLRRIVLILIIVVGLAYVFFAFGRPSFHRIQLKAYFQDAQGLREGAPVRLAGVDVGTVTSVRARPELRDSPAEVTLGLLTTYELSVPTDATAYISSGGLLGGTDVGIDVREATGPPIGNQGVLKSREASGPTTQQLLQHLLETVSKESCPAAAQSESSQIKKSATGTGALGKQ